MKGGDRLVDQGVAPRLLDIWRLRRADRHEAEEAANAVFRRTAPDQRAQHGRRLVEPADADRRRNNRGGDQETGGEREGGREGKRHRNSRQR